MLLIIRGGARRSTEGWLSKFHEQERRVVVDFSWAVWFNGKSVFSSVISGTNRQKRMNVYL